MFNHIWIVQFILVTIVTTQTKWQPCQYASPRKFNGYFYLTIGTANVVAFHHSNEQNKTMCNKKCKINDKCLATSFSDDEKCSFYDTNNFRITPGNGIDYYQWLPCNMTYAYQPDDGRCKGLWVEYLDTFITVTSYSYLEVLYVKDHFMCQHKCLKNSLCGFINFKDFQCKLVPKWPNNNLDFIDQINWKVYEWTCEDNFVNNFHIKKEIKKPNDRKCTGYWKINNRQSIFNTTNKIGLNFQTQSYNQCLDECNQYSNCFTAWFNVSYSVCVLNDIEKSHEQLRIKTHNLLNSNGSVN